jgi:hypothetical protein
MFNHSTCTFSLYYVSDDDTGLIIRTNLTMRLTTILPLHQLNLTRQHLQKVTLGCVFPGMMVIGACTPLSGSGSIVTVI